MRAISCCVLTILAAIAQAQSPPENSRGDLLYTTHCVGCHTTAGPLARQEARVRLGELERAGGALAEEREARLERRRRRCGRAASQRRVLPSSGVRRKARRRRHRPFQIAPARLIAPSRVPAVTDYLNPDLPAGLRRVAMPVVDATSAALDGYRQARRRSGGVRDRNRTLARAGPRARSTSTPATKAGTTQGTFVSEWQGDILFGRNDAVGGHYILAYADEPATADATHRRDPRAHPAVARELSSRTAASCSSRSTGSRSSSRSRFPATTSQPDGSSSASASTGPAASTSIRTSGTKVCSRRAARSDSSTSRAPCMRACRSTSRASSGACVEAPIA